MQPSVRDAVCYIKGLMTALPPVVLFDLDGTLVDSIELIVESMGHAFAGRARIPTRAEWVAGIGTPIRTQVALFVSDQGDADEILEAYNIYFRAHYAEMKPYPGAVECLTALKARGHALGAVTSKLTEGAHRTLRQVGLAELMEVVVGCDACARPKPAPDPVLFALRQLGREPNEAFFVGDSPHDIQSGRAAGVTTIAALWGPFAKSDLERHHPDRYAEYIDKIVELTRSLS